MIVATAGHIDHGKTRLVKRLTGVDTDRLPQERARGISIDLGFAHAEVEGVPISFIDVPGHERFIRNMLAGVCAIDAVLLVVAADDGVMPQTTEHLHILDLMDVSRGAAVITKTDLVSPARVLEVAQQVQAMLAGSALAQIEHFPVSLVSGDGVDALRQWLAALAEPALEAGGADGRQFRLAVDRVFTVAGSGTVVTGTVHAGQVAVGDHLLVSPVGREVRVRGVRAQGATVEVACAGQRCALNLSGTSVEQVIRGDWIVHPDLHAPARRIDVRLKVLSDESAPLEHWSQVHLHHGTADVPARVAMPGEGSVAPGNSGYAQLVLERPIAALHGDRFVIRDPGARRTIGGGRVLDPFAPKRQRRAGARSAELQMLEQASPGAIVSSLLAISEGGLDLAPVFCNLNLPRPRADVLLRELDAVVLGKELPRALTRAAADLLGARVLAVLREFHAAQPQAAGVEMAALRTQAAPRLPMAAFRAFTRELANRQHIVLSNDVVRLRDHEATANPQDEQLWQRVQRSLMRAGVASPTVSELAARLNVAEGLLRDFLHRKSRTGELLRIAPDRFCLRATLAALAATAVQVAAGTADGFFNAGQFRDAIATGRGLAIRYLELFDRLGITQRFGDRRRIGKEFVAQLGPAEPLAHSFISNKETTR